MNFISFIRIAVSASILTLWTNFAGAATTSPFSGLEIPGSCLTHYQSGQKRIEKKLKEGFDFSDQEKKIALFDQLVSSTTLQCQFYMSLGLHDALAYIKQHILVEYALEDQQTRDLPAAMKKSIFKLYRARLNKIGESPEVLNDYLKQSDLLESTRSHITKALNEQADKEMTAVPFGRFLFLGRLAGVHTTYEYEFDKNGAFKKDQGGQVVMQPGSYQKLARRHFERTKTIVEEYLAWKPSIFFGKDSFWYGSIRRYFSKNPEKSIREIKEEGYFRRMQMMMNSARRFRLDTKPYREMLSLMMKKQRAFLQRDLKAYDMVDKYKWAALFVPVGMYVGASAMAATGWMSAVPSGSTGVYLGGSLSYAANTSALISLGVIGSYSGYGVYHSVSEYQAARKRGEKVRLADLMDNVFMAAIQSFPLAAIAPVVVGGSMYAGQAAYLSGRNLLLNAVRLSKHVYRAGFSGTMKEVGSFALRLPGKLVRMPRFVFKQWLKAWYKNPKLLLTHYGVDIAFSVFYDCGYRQMTEKGKEKCYYRNDHGKFEINESVIYGVAGTVIIGPLAKPIAFIPGFGMRWLSYRAFGFVSTVLIQLAIKGELNKDYLVFNSFYGATFGTGFGEVGRAFKLSPFVTSKSAGAQAALIILYKALVHEPVTTPLYVNLEKLYRNGDLTSPSKIKRVLKEHIQIDIDDFSDEDLRATLGVLEEEFAKTYKAQSPMQH